MSAVQEYESYKRIKLLGEGSFGKAFLVESVTDGSKCVLKQVDLGKMSEEEKRDTLKEAKILEVLNHPNIVRFREVYKTKKGKLCIVMDYADGGDLSNKIKEMKGQYFNENQILDWFTQISLAMKHVHDRKILHRDLKCQNIFLTKANIIKLGDFGIARVLNNTRDNAKTMVGTPYYLSPELVNGKSYSFKSDIWSLGVVLYELCALKPPFDASSLTFLAMKIVKGQYSPIPNQYTKELKNLVSSLLQIDPLKRPTINDILGMPLIQNRIKTFLTETVRVTEFSHTVLHKKNVVKPGGKLDDIKKVNNEEPMPAHMVQKLKQQQQEAGAGGSGVGNNNNNNKGIEINQQQKANVPNLNQYAKQPSNGNVQTPSQVNSNQSNAKPSIQQSNQALIQNNNQQVILPKKDDNITPKPNYHFRPNQPSQPTQQQQQQQQQQQPYQGPKIVDGSKFEKNPPASIPKQNEAKPIEYKNPNPTPLPKDPKLMKNFSADGRQPQLNGNPEKQYVSKQTPDAKLYDNRSPPMGFDKMSGYERDNRIQDRKANMGPQSSNNPSANPFNQYQDYNRNKPIPKPGSIDQPKPIPSEYNRPITQQEAIRKDQGMNKDPRGILTAFPPQQQQQQQEARKMVNNPPAQVIKTPTPNFRIIPERDILGGGGGGIGGGGACGGFGGGIAFSIPIGREAGKKPSTYESIPKQKVNQNPNDKLKQIELQKKRYEEEKQKKEQELQNDKKRKELLDQERIEKEKKREEERRQMKAEIQRKREMARKKNQNQDPGIEWLGGQQPAELDDDGTNGNNVASGGSNNEEEAIMKTTTPPRGISNQKGLNANVKQEEKQQEEVIIAKPEEEKIKKKKFIQKPRMTEDNKSKKEDFPIEIYVPTKKSHYNYRGVIDDNSNIAPKSTDTSLKTDDSSLSNINNEPQQQIKKLSSEDNMGIESDVNDDELATYNALIAELNKIVENSHQLQENNTNNNINDNPDSIEDINNNNLIKEPQPIDTKSNDDNYNTEEPIRNADIEEIEEEEDRDDDDFDETLFDLTADDTNLMQLPKNEKKDEQSMEYFSDYHKIEALKMLLEDQLGDEILLKAYKTIKELIDKESLESIEEKYAKNDHYGTLFPFITLEKREKYLPLVMTLVIMEETAENYL